MNEKKKITIKKMKKKSFGFKFKYKKKKYFQNTISNENNF